MRWNFSGCRRTDGKTDGTIQATVRQEERRRLVAIERPLRVLESAATMQFYLTRWSAGQTSLCMHASTLLHVAAAADRQRHVFPAFQPRQSGLIRGIMLEPIATAMFVSKAGIV